MDQRTIAVMIPIVAIVMGIGIGMLGLILNYKKRKEMFALYHQERMAAIDKGIELPPLPEAFFSEDPKTPTPHRHLLKGLVWLFLGVAITIVIYANHRQSTALFGLIPAAVGLAHLIYYALVGKKAAEAAEALERAKLSETKGLRGVS